MDGFTAAFESATLASCQANVAEIAAALTRAFGKELRATVAGLVDSSKPAPAAWRGPGLMIPLRIAGEDGGDVVAIMPAASGLLPDWVAQPDAKGVSLRETLAQELSPLLFAPQVQAVSRPTVWAPDLSATFEYTPKARSRHHLSLTVTSGSSVGAVEIIWPVVIAAMPTAAPKASAGSASAAATMQRPEGPASPASPSPSRAPLHYDAAEGDGDRDSNELTLESLPSFSRNLLRIKMPVMVTLASKKQSVGKIIELLPGSIIQFSKSCEEMLEMEVSGHPIALGECVKVGDKFGLRVTSIQLPGERFETVTHSRASR